VGKTGGGDDFPNPDSPEGGGKGAQDLLKNVREEGRTGRASILNKERWDADGGEGKRPIEARGKACRKPQASKNRQEARGGAVEKRSSSYVRKNRKGVEGTKLLQGGKRGKGGRTRQEKPPPRKIRFERGFPSFPLGAVIEGRKTTVP